MTIPTLEETRRMLVEDGDFETLAELNRVVAERERAKQGGIVKSLRGWIESLHPRDAFGRFRRKGATVRPIPSAIATPLGELDRRYPGVLDRAKISAKGHRRHGASVGAGLAMESIAGAIKTGIVERIGRARWNRSIEDLRADLRQERHPAHRFDADALYLWAFRRWQDLHNRGDTKGEGAVPTWGRWLDRTWRSVSAGVSAAREEWTGTARVHAVTPDEPIYVGADVDRAAELLAQGKRVELDQPRTASTLTRKLADLVHEAEAAGKDAPDYDLCRVTVAHTNLFCVESKGIPRVEMPQLKGIATPGSKAAKLDAADRRGETDLSEHFLRHLEGLGYKVVETVVPAADLRATQRELDGAKVSGMMHFIRHGGRIEGPPIWTTSDDYVVD
ncbi:MAG TPA: hypothetical protein VIU37_02470, partial [Candidatus Limnocylindrales bacterium]